MPDHVTILPKCPRCARPVPANAAKGLCPACLVHSLFEVLEEDPLEAGPQIPAPAGPAERLGEYELLEELGRGGMGIVFRARDARLNRVVALKLLLTGKLASETEIKRFLTEAEAAAQLEHPNIVPIYEVGQADGRHFFAMKFMEGGHLGELRGRAAGESGPRFWAETLVKVARGVHHAHQRGILHRDLKPGNILLDAAGEPAVSDFGLARRLKTDSELTQTGAVIGSPSYMAPEQAAGRSREVTTAADVYCLGAVLFHLLTGKPPFLEDTPIATMRAVVEREPPRPATLNSAVDRDLETICLKCLEKQPAHRYASAAAFAEDLERWLRGEPVLARRAGWTERAWKSAKRHPAIAALLAFVVVAAAGFVLLLAAHSANLRHERNLAQLERNNALRQEQRAKAEALLTRQSLYAVDIFNAHSALETGDYDLAWRALSSYQPAAETVLLAEAQAAPDLRGFEWRHLWERAQGEQALVWTGHAQEIVALETSRDGRWVASGDSDGSVRLWDLTARRDQPVWQAAPDGGDVLSLSFSADSQRLVSSAGYAVRVRDAASGKVLLDLGATGRIAHAFFCHTAPERLIVLSGPSGDRLERFEVFDSPQTNAIVSVKGEHLGNVFALSLDGQWLAQCDHRDIHLRDTATGAERSRWRSPNYVIALAFSPDGQQLAASELRQGTVALWDIAARQLTARFAVSSGLVSGAAFSPGGQTLAIAGFDQTVRLWDLGQRRELQRWRGHRGGVRVVTFSRDGDLASGGVDATVRIWPGAALPQKAPLTNAAGPFAFGQDGRQLAIADLDGGVTLWDLPACRPSRRWGMLPVNSLLYSPQTNLLLAASIQDTNQPPLLTRLPLAGEGEPVSLPLRGAPAQATDIQIAPNGQVCITGHSNGAVVFWDTGSGTSLGAVNAFTNAVDQIFVSPNSEYLFAKTWSPMRFATFHVPTRQMLTNVLLAKRYTVTVAFWPDGHKFAIAGDPSRDIKILDTATLKLLGTLLGHPDRVRCLAFSPDARTLVSEGRERSFRFWQLATGRQMLGWPQPEWTRQLAFSPDGSWLGASDYAGSLRLWHAPPLAK